MPNLKLTYFDGPGRAEPIRMALHMAGRAFEDHRIKFPEFAAKREQGAFPLRSVPVLEVDGVRIAQTGAILRYVARLDDTGLYPADSLRALVVDSVLDSMNDTLAHALMPSLFERDMTRKLEMRAAFVAGPMKDVLTYVESLLEHYGGPFVAGESPSIADLVVAAQVRQIQSGGLDGVAAEALSPYTRVQALAAAVEADPRVVAYRRAQAG
jgi:glutathione S-transferase